MMFRITSCIILFETVKKAIPIVDFENSSQASRRYENVIFRGVVRCIIRYAYHFYILMVVFSVFMVTRGGGNSIRLPKYTKYRIKLNDNIGLRFFFVM